jgi:hypothetical protein
MAGDWRPGLQHRDEVRGLALAAQEFRLDGLDTLRG